MAVFTAVALGVAAAGAAASAIAKKKAADKAASIQKKGIEQQKTILQKKLDPQVLNKLAQDADKERAQNRIALQESVDPELAALRKKGKEQLLAQANIKDEDKQSSKLATTLFNETNTADPRLQALKDSLITAAQKELDSGATLPPEFQGELVRAGLNTGSQAGLGITKNSIGGGVARALGFGGFQLQQQRQQAAQNLANTAQNLVNARSSILSSVFPKLRDLESTRRIEAAQNFQLADQALPESGLSGQEIVNARVAQQRGVANAIGAKSNVKAGQAIMSGQTTGALIGAGTSLATGGLGLAAGPGGGVAGSIFSKAPAPVGSDQGMIGTPGYGTTN